jgi:hypothetical protein
VTQTETEPQAIAPSTQPPVGKLPPGTYANLPAIPFWAGPDGKPDPTHTQMTELALKTRAAEGAYAYQGLSVDYTIGGKTAKAYEFLYGSDPGGPFDGPLAPLAQLALDKADQFTLPWTNYGDVYKDSLPLRGPFSDTLKSSHKDIATKSFWPTIANFGIPYNLLALSKIDQQRVGDLKKEFGPAWTAEDMDAKVAAGLAYEIDVKIIENLKSSTAPDGTTRFAPGSITLLTQDAQTKALTPVAIKLFSGDDGTTRVYTKGDNAWIYALQAAKASITVWGIWIGHVGHWHIPTAAMQMAMYNKLPTTHPLSTLLLPQSEFLIDFDYVLLQGTDPEGHPIWDAISPPTPVAGADQLLPLLNTHFAGGRGFFEDDPERALKKKGIVEGNFTGNPNSPWDSYPLAGWLVGISRLCKAFVEPVVNALYPQGDGEVKGDTDLQAWLTASRDPSGGNVQLPAIETREQLTELLTSLLYRVTAHAAGSLTPVVNPALAFVSNFPPCLQKTDMPQPGDSVSDADLLTYMPRTGTMGQMTTFYFTFAYSLPYAPAIPFGGDNADLYWPQPGTPADQTCNAALVKYRRGIRSFVKAYTTAWNEELARILGVPAGPIPPYAENQAEQVPRSIEI